MPYEWRRHSPCGKSSLEVRTSNAERKEAVVEPVVEVVVVVVMVIVTPREVTATEVIPTPALNSSTDHRL